MKRRNLINRTAICLYLGLCLVFVSCKNTKNVDDTIKWIDQAEKPIIVKYHTTNGMTMEKRYTLIDAKSRVYNTGCVELTLPDTLK